MHLPRPTVLTLVLVLACACVPLRAADLSIGMSADISNMDPHFANITSAAMVQRHIFDRLVAYDAKGGLQARLAQSWKNVDDLTWEFKLRQGVKFHDGSELTAEDVVWSLERPATLTNSPSPFTVYTKGIVERTVVDKYTVRLKTAQPNAMLLQDLSSIAIASKKAAAGLSTDDMNSGRGLVGSGPFKFVRFARGDRVELARNENYWDTAPEWERVSFRILTTPAARVAALLSGDVQMIEGVPPADVARLKGEKGVTIFSTPSSRLIYLALDVDRDASPFLTDKAGKALTKNPLKDLRVRRAISKIIARPAIVEKVMEGNAVAAGQFLPLGSFGTAAELAPEAPDVAGAKKLLAEAGYPDGFGITLHGTSDRYVNDAKVLQTIAQMLQRAGIAAKVDSMPTTVYFPRRTKLEFSAGMAGWGGGVSHPASYLRALAMTYNDKTGAGAVNTGRYSNAKLDALVDQAYLSFDTAKQEKLWQDATRLAMAELAVIPLHHQVNIWAARKGIVVTPRSDEATYAWEVRAAK